MALCWYSKRYWEFRKNNPWLKKKILIIGGSGFLGEGLYKFLRKRYNVYKTTLKKKSTSKVLKLDLRNKIAIKKFFNQNDFHYVINLGGYIDHSNLSQNGDEVLQVHLESLFYICKFINKKNYNTLFK